MVRSVQLQKIDASSLAMPGSMPVLLAVHEAENVLEAESSSGTVAVGATICVYLANSYTETFFIAVMVGSSEVVVVKSIEAVVPELD